MGISGRVITVRGNPRSLAFIFCDEGEWGEPPEDVVKAIESGNLSNIDMNLGSDTYLVVGSYNEAITAKKSCIEKITDFLMFASEVLGLDIDDI